MAHSAGRIGAGATSLALTLALVAGGSSAALAATPPGTSPAATPHATPTSTTAPAGRPSAAVVAPSRAELLAAQKDEKAKAAEVALIGEQVITLQHQADRAGKASQQADERALRERAAADTALAARHAAETEAEAVAATALASRTRASALAANLARTDLGTLPLSLVLNSRISAGTLRGLSTASQLSSVADRVYRRAQGDEATAKRAKAAAEAAATRADAASAAAASAAAAAKKASEATAHALRSAQKQEQALVLDLAVLRRTTEQAACDSLAAMHHRPRCDARTVAATARTAAGRAVAFARARIGDPYVFAAAGPRAWDCSGLTMGAYASVGIDIGPHSATAQFRLEQAAGHLVPFSAVQPGDLLFYKDGSGDIYHTTIYSGDGMMIEAPYAGADVREVPVRTTDLVDEVARPLT
ncbi:MAG TPA: C40 family peptidase [Amnibacterium sp.]|nr:C40 family peptidase [Amnibacterium sp.]